MGGLPTNLPAEIMGAPTAVFIVALIVGVALVFRLWKAIKLHRDVVIALEEAHRYFAEVAQRKRFTPIHSSVLLKPGEAAFFSGSASLCESRAVRHYESGYTGFRLAKGVYVGGSKGRSVSSSELKLIDRGTLTITNQRLVFDGSHEDRILPLSRIVAVDPTAFSLDVSTEGRQKSMMFFGLNGLMAGEILRICRAIENPLDMSKNELDFDFNLPSRYDWKLIPLVASALIVLASGFVLWKKGESNRALGSVAAKPSESATVPNGATKAVLGSQSPSEMTEMRTWKDAQGRSLTAALVALNKNGDGLFEGKFRRPDGTEFQYVIGKLCADDVKLVRGLVDQKPVPAAR